LKKLYVTEATVQAESDPIAECRERLRALRSAAELAAANQGDEEFEKQPFDTTATEQQKEDVCSTSC
jgi:hypothetical protein